MADKFKKGDKVRIDKKSVYYDKDSGEKSNNPANMDGVIIDVHTRSSYNIMVKWNNNITNSYHDWDLVKVKTDKPMATTVVKFKKGDKIIGLGKKPNDYNITCKGWKGVVIDVSGDGKYITVKGSRDSSSYPVEAKYFELQKTEKMATKATAKKEDIKLKDGQYFTAMYKPYGSKKAAVKIRGAVMDISSTWNDAWALCNKGVGDLAPDGPDENEGFTHRIEFEVGEDENTLEIMAEMGITEFFVQTDRRMKNIINTDKAPMFKSYSVTVNGDNISFGCGAIEVTKKQVEQFANIKELIEKNGIGEDLLNEIEDLSDKNFNNLISFLTELKKLGGTKSFGEYKETCRDIDREDSYLSDEITSKDVRQLLASL